MNDHKAANDFMQKQFGIPESLIDEVVIAFAEQNGWGGFMNNWGGGDKQRHSSRTGALMPAFKIRRYQPYNMLLPMGMDALHIQLENAVRAWENEHTDGLYKFSHVYEDANGWTCVMFVLR